MLNGIDPSSYDFENLLEDKADDDVVEEEKDDSDDYATMLPNQKKGFKGSIPLLSLHVPNYNFPNHHNFPTYHNLHNLSTHPTTSPAKNNLFPSMLNVDDELNNLQALEQQLEVLEGGNLEKFRLLDLKERCADIWNCGLQYKNHSKNFDAELDGSNSSFERDVSHLYSCSDNGKNNKNNNNNYNINNHNNEININGNGANAFNSAPGSELINRYFLNNINNNNNNLNYINNNNNINNNINSNTNNNGSYSTNNINTPFFPPNRVASPIWMAVDNRRSNTSSNFSDEYCSYNNIHNNKHNDKHINKPSDKTTSLNDKETKRLYRIGLNIFNKSAMIHFC